MILHLNPRDGENRDLTVLVHRPITPPRPEVEPDERELRSQGARLAEELIARLPGPTFEGLFNALSAEWWSDEPKAETVAAVTHDGACAGCADCLPLGMVGAPAEATLSVEDGESMDAIRAIEDAIDATSDHQPCLCSVPASRTAEAVLAALREIGWKP